MNDEQLLAERLTSLVCGTPWLITALRAAREHMTAPWCIAAGAVRSLVWNSLHGFPLLPPEELDLVYFDAERGQADDVVVAAALAREVPEVQWDVVNQAHAHTLTGQVDAPKFASLQHAMACWPETATAVGVFLGTRFEFGLVAPYGLTDLFDLVLRPSPGLRHPDAFVRRLADKRFLARWPRLRVESTSLTSDPSCHPVLL